VALLSRLGNLIKHGAYVPTEYYVRDDSRAVYIPVPKVACTSIKEAFYEISPSGQRYEEYMEIHKRLSANATYSLKSEHLCYFKFAFVRNPFDRLVSCYKDKVRKELQHNGRYYFDTRYAKFLLRGASGFSFRPSMTFSDFVLAVSRIPDALADGHFRSQYHYLYREPTCCPDYIGRFENADSDWVYIRKRLGLPSIKRRNETASVDLSSWYEDISLIEIVRKRYWQDIDMWYLSDYESLRKKAIGSISRIKGI